MAVSCLYQNCFGRGGVVFFSGNIFFFNKFKKIILFFRWGWQLCYRKLRSRLLPRTFIKMATFFKFQLDLPGIYGENFVISPILLRWKLFATFDCEFMETNVAIFPSIFIEVSANYWNLWLFREFIRKIETHTFALIYM